MAINLDKPHLWEQDTECSVDMYNEWFLRFAPATYLNNRFIAFLKVARAIKATQNLRHIDASVLQEKPRFLPVLRMSTSPPLAVDRLIGLTGVSRNLVKVMEKYQQLPQKMGQATLEAELAKICETISTMVDKSTFVWLKCDREPTREELYRAAMVVADRLCGAEANPIIRNAQEQRQLAAIENWLSLRGYARASEGTKYDQMLPGTYSFRLNVPVNQTGGGKTVNIPVDAVVMPNGGANEGHPILIEAKSAGDYTNVNKRRKEEATKMNQLKATYGQDVRFVLFLCGYFDSGYLSYEAAEGIDWVWEHRIRDFELLGL